MNKFIDNNDLPTLIGGDCIVSEEMERYIDWDLAWQISNRMNTMGAVRNYLIDSLEDGIDDL